MREFNHISSVFEQIYFHKIFSSINIYIFKNLNPSTKPTYQTALIFPSVYLSYYSLRFDSILFRSQPQWCTMMATRESNSLSLISLPTFFQPWFRKSSVQFSVVWLWLWFFRKSGKDFSTAILERKKLPNRLLRRQLLRRFAPWYHTEVPAFPWRHDSHQGIRFKGFLIFNF